MKQLDLFKQNFIKKERIYYRNLNINQKINVKANSCGFQMTYYGFYKYHPLRNDDNFKELTYNWFWHYKKNYYRSLSTLMHIKLNFSKIQFNY